MNAMQRSETVFNTEDLLTSLCNSVTKVLVGVATQSPITYSGMALSRRRPRTRTR
ncbi:MAG: DUF3334 family protein [Pseudomonadota bacterium]|jgi:hypothetical protein